MIRILICIKKVSDTSSLKELRLDNEKIKNKNVNFSNILKKRNNFIQMIFIYMKNIFLSSDCTFSRIYWWYIEIILLNKIRFCQCLNGYFFIFSILVIFNLFLRNNMDNMTLHGKIQIAKFSVWELLNISPLCFL